MHYSLSRHEDINSCSGVDERRGFMFAQLTRSLAVGLAASCAGISMAQADTGSGAWHAQLAPTTFQVKVAGARASGTTLWVAYGPLAGRFGIVRMRNTGGGIYRAQLQLPRGARGQFSYIAGHGTMSSRQGIVPGNPVSTIGHVGPTIIGQSHIPMMVWHPPIG
jgi:hypothetical protein